MARWFERHSWDVTASEAVALQNELRGLIHLEPYFGEIKTVAGCDISFNRFSDVVFAGVVVLDFPSLTVIERKGVRTEAKFPYVPGLLSFREIPALAEAWALLETEPDVVVVDGQGIAHPRRMGIASHFGLFVERPTVGVAKSLLVGHYEKLADAKGATSPLLHHADQIGVALRTKIRANPVFVSPGHRIDIAGAVELIRRCDGGYRIPEPTRQAHLFVNELRRAGEMPTSSKRRSIL